MSKVTQRQIEIWRRRYGREVRVWGGRVYFELPPGMKEAPINRMPCPHCETNVVEFYHVMWANQHGVERRYFCECGRWFQVRAVEGSEWFTVLEGIHRAGQGHDRAL